MFAAKTVRETCAALIFFRRVAKRLREDRAGGTGEKSAGGAAGAFTAHDACDPGRTGEADRSVEAAKGNVRGGHGRTAVRNGQER